MAGTDDTTEQSVIEAALTGAGAGGPWYPVPPLMHAAAQWTAFSALHQGASVVLHDDSGGLRSPPACSSSPSGSGSR